MRTMILAAAVLGLSACQPATPDASGPDPTTGAAGAVTGPTDPNPTGADATTSVQPGDPSGAMGSTPPTLPEPDAPATPTLPPT